MLKPQVFQLVAVEHNRQGMIMGHADLALAPVGTVTHPSINQAYDCLTSVINHEMLGPSY